MGWEWHGPTLAYVRKRRVGNTVQSEYVGTGDAALLAEGYDRMMRDLEARKRAAERKQRENAERFDGEIARLSAATKMLTKATLVSAGYYEHRRGWRRVGMKSKQGERGSNSLALTTATEPKTFATIKEAGDALQKYVEVKEPGPQVIEEIRRALDAYPNAWRFFGDLNWQLREQMVGVLPTYVVQESTRRGLDKRGHELGLDDASGLEKLLIEQVLLCWLQFYLTHNHYDQVVIGEAYKSNGLYWERRLSMVQSRLLKATRVLATVRSLMKGAPPVQLNIANQQINTVAPAKE